MKKNSKDNGGNHINSENFDKILDELLNVNIRQSMTNLVKAKLDKIDELKSKGVSYKKIAESIGINYAHFIVALNRAKSSKSAIKKIDQKKSNTDAIIEIADDLSVDIAIEKMNNKYKPLFKK